MRIFIFLLFVLLISCSSNIEIYLDKIDNIKLGSKESGDNLDFYFANAFLKKIPSGNILQNGILFKQKSVFIQISYPREINLEIPSLSRILFIDLNKDYIILCSSNIIFIYDSKNNLIDKYEIDEKQSIKGVILSKSQIIYFLNNKLLMYEIKTKKISSLLPYKFKSPYKEEFKVDIQIDANIIQLLIGNAGSYYLSVIDLSDNRYIVSNLSLSARSFYADRNNVYGIKGNSSDWKLIKFSLKSKNIENIKKLNNIVDIKIFRHGCIYEDPSSTWILNFNKNKIKVPFDYKIIGKLNKSLIIEYNKNLYITSFEIFFNEIKKLKILLPQLF